MNSPISPKKSVLDEHLDGQHKSFPGRLRAYFLAGILVTAPIGITIYLTWHFLLFIDSRVNSIIPAHLDPFQLWPAGWPGVEVAKAVASVILVGLFFVMVGWFARNYLGRFLYRVSEYVVDQMPVVRSLYGAIKQIFETVMTSQSQAFRDVVMFEFPRKGIWAMGFVTGVTKGEVQRLTEEEVVNVFYPTTPNPTSGFLVFIPRKDLVYMDMSVEEAIKMIVSGGIITPPDRGLKNQSDGEF